MSLTASEMKRLDVDAHAIASRSCRGYIADALVCLRDTRDPIAPVALLRAMWGTAHARRAYQKAALDDAGRWLEKRLGLQPDITPEQFVLELGWLQRLMAIHGASDDRDRRSAPRSTGQHGHDRDEPAFGAHLDRLRQRRESLLAAAAEASAHRAAAQDDLKLPEARPTQLPGSFEACFTSWQEAMSAFRKARERRRDKRPAKDRLLPVQPIADDLRPLAADIACSLLDTEGMNELEARAIADVGKLPAFWIAVADLVERDGKRVARRISFESGRRAEMRRAAYNDDEVRRPTK